MKNSKAKNARKALNMAINDAISKVKKKEIELSVNDILSVADKNFKLLESISN